MSYEVWMKKDDGFLFIAVPLYTRTERELYDPDYDIFKSYKNSNYNIFKYTSSFFGYCLDVGDDNDISYGMTVNAKALHRIAERLGEL